MLVKILIKIQLILLILENTKIIFKEFLDIFSRLPVVRVAIQKKIIIELISHILISNINTGISFWSVVNKISVIQVLFKVIEMIQL